MCQIGSTREIICWTHWRDHHGDRIRRLYWWHTVHWGNLSQTMQHQSGAPNQVTRALRRYNSTECGFEDGDWGPQDGQYWPSPTGVPHAESQGPLRYAFCAVPCKLSGGGPCQSWHHNSRAKTKTHEGDSTPDITQLFFLDLAETGWKATWFCTHMQ